MAEDGDKPTPTTQILRPKLFEEDMTKPSAGYQAERVGKKLDQLEAEGTELRFHTRMELRRKLEKIFEAEQKSLGLPPPSRQVMNGVIKQRLPK